MQHRELSYLLAPWGVNAPLCPLREMVLDSRQAASGDLFIAMIGHKVDARRYIHQAVAHGVAAVVAEADNIAQEGSVQEVYGVPVVYLHSLRCRLSRLAQRFYQPDEQKMQLVGVTGTNGKTTTTHLVAQWIEKLGYRSAVMGTLGSGFVGQTKPTNNTTGSAIEIQQTLSKWANDELQLVAMEVSSHGLVQDRVAALSFDVALFTNLTQDHLDYHGDLQNYAQAKLRLFTQHLVKHTVLNADDPLGYQWLQLLPNVVAVSTNKKHLSCWRGNQVVASKVIHHVWGAVIHIESSWGNGILESHLLGAFNVSNILLSLASLLALGYPLVDLLITAEQLTPICGRMEQFCISGKPKVVIDYAHTPDALKKAIEAVRLHHSGCIWCVFGCGGERDQTKRSLMGAIAEQGADYLIITTDNPRFEDPKVIIQDILAGMVHPKQAKVILDRGAAIISAVMQAVPGDAILIAGKGHENYQIVGANELEHSDRKLVADLLGIAV